MTFFHRWWVVTYFQFVPHIKETVFMIIEVDRINQLLCDYLEVREGICDYYLI